jgi:hypothetical protein
MLHTGNSVVPTQQWLDFGVLPFIEHWPAQGLGSLLPGYFYSKLAGLSESNVLTLSTWYSGILPLICSVLSTYFIFSRLIRPDLSFLICLFLPFEISLVQNAYSLLPILLITWVIQKPSFYRFLCIWLTVILVFVLMPSAGKGACIGLILFCFIYYIKNLQILLYSYSSFIILIIFFAFIYYLLTIIKDVEFSDNISLIKSYADAEWAIGSYTNIYKQFDFKVIFQMFLTPFVTILICIYYFKLRIKKRQISKIHIYILILSCFNLFLYLRTLGRHSLAEKSSPILFLIILFLLIFIKFRKHYVKLTILLLFVSYLSIQMSYLRNLSLNFSAYQWNRSSHQRGKIEISTDLGNIIQFLNDNLSENETFIDLVNSHFLYSLTNKYMPFFHHSTQVIQSYKPQEIYIKQIQKLRNKKTIPILLFKSDTFYGKIDLIPSSQSLFILSEFLYDYYVPYKTIGNYEIWVDKESNLYNKLNFKNNYSVEQNYEWQKLPYFWAKYGNFIISQVDSNISLTTIDSRKTQLKKENLKFIENNRFLHLSILATEPGQLNVTVNNNEHVGEFSLEYESSSTPVDYIVPINCLYASFMDAGTYSFSSTNKILLQTYLP